MVLSGGADLSASEFSVIDFLYAYIQSKSTTILNNPVKAVYARQVVKIVWGELCISYPARYLR